MQLRSFIEGELKKYEGRTDHMYLDSVGRVTIGVGHLIADRDAVASLTMYKAKSTSTIASLKGKKDEYDTIAKQSQGYRASWYKKHCTLIMKEATALVSIIEAQRTRIHKAQQLDLPLTQLTEVEKEQLRDEREHMKKRLAAMDKELQSEPEELRALYRVALKRLEPVGLVYLWPSGRL